MAINIDRTAVRTTIAYGTLLMLSAAACAQTGTLIAPPRTISDITAILDQQEPETA